MCAALKNEKFSEWSRREARRNHTGETCLLPVCGWGRGQGTRGGRGERGDGARATGQGRRRPVPGTGATPSLDQKMIEHFKLVITANIYAASTQLEFPMCQTLF